MKDMHISFQSVVTSPFKALKFSTMDSLCRSFGTKKGWKTVLATISDI